MKKTISSVLAGLLLTSTFVYAKPNDKVLVTVNGSKIYRSQIDDALFNATQGRPELVPADKKQAFKEGYLKRLIAEELIYEDAKKIGVLKTKEFKDEYKKQIENVKKVLALKFWQKKQADMIKISDKELHKYYNDNKNEFAQPAMVHARHILVKTEAEAKAIRKELSGLDSMSLKTKFMELAKSKSIGPSSKKGGDLGYFSAKQMVPAFSNTAFSMEPGTISKPVHSQFGYHIIYVEDKKPAQNRTFAEVKDFIKQRLKMEKFKNILKSKMENLKDSAVIK